MGKGHYTMNVNRAKKELNIMIVGNFTTEQAQRYASDYNANVKSINPSEYVLRLDCRDLNVITQDLVDSLEACYSLYQSSRFNKVIIEIKQVAILKMQLNRLARKVGLNCDIVEVSA